MDVLLQYYGLDWLSMLSGFLGAWLITERKRTGFLFMIASVLMALATALMAEQYGFVVANMINIMISIRGFIKWRAEEQMEQGLSASA